MAGHLLQNTFKEAYVYFWLFLGTLILSAGVNGILLLYVFRSTSTAFSHWRLVNTSVFDMSILLSLFDMQAIYIITSKVFDISATDATLSKRTEWRLNTASYIS